MLDEIPGQIVTGRQAPSQRMGGLLMGHFGILLGRAERSTPGAPACH